MTPTPSQPQNPSSAMRQAAERVEQVEKKVEKNLPTREEAEHMLEEWKDQLADKWDQAKHYIQDFKTQDLGEQVSGTIRRYPWTSLAVSFAVGALLGNRLFKRR